MKKKKKLNNLEKNFSDFLRLEEKEAGELAGGKESFSSFCRDSSRIFKDYFIPHRGNGHKPKILRPKSLTVIAIALMMLKVSVTGYLFFIYPDQAKMASEMTGQILILTNESRAAGNLDPLKIDPVLSEAALAKANDMIKLDYFAHIGPSGVKPWDWVDKNEYAYIYMGENLGMNFSSAESVHNALMASPAHKKNIMNNNYKDIGLAVISGIIDGEETNLLVEIFGSKKSLVPTPVSVAKTSETTVPSPVTQPAEIKALSQTDVLAIEKNSTDNQPLITDKEPDPIPPLGTRETAVMASSSAPIKLENANQTTAAVTQQNDISPNQEIDNHLPPSITYIAPVNDQKINLAGKLLDFSKYIYYAVLIFMIMVLLINIFIKINVQHKSVIIQTMVLIILIVGLITLRFHFLENADKLVAVI